MLEAADLAVFGLVMIVSTVLLLGLGAAAGYRAGLHTVQVGTLTARCDCGWGKHELAECAEAGERIERQCKNLSALLARHSAHLPDDVRRAIDQLLVSTTRFNRRLAEMGDGRLRRGAAATQNNSVAACSNANTDTVPMPRASSGSTLSSEEMRRLTRVEPSASDPAGASRQRYSYDCVQKAVPRRQGEPGPTISDLLDVRCHDISRRGVSFFWPTEPDFEDVFISVGSGECMNFMRAKVVHSKEVFMHDEFMFVVGCEFIGRMSELTDEWKRVQLLEASANS